MTPLELQHLDQGYRGRPVIKDLSLRLEQGVFGLLGPNGAGKTTLLRTLATATKPAGGHLRLFGVDNPQNDSLRAVRRRIGYLPQSFGFDPRMTVRDFVYYCAWLREINRTSIEHEATSALRQVGLASEAGTRMRKLSGGMLRRAGIAQALVGKPELLILDEPTTGLDPHQRIGFRALIRKLGAQACVVLSTHLVEDVTHTCGRVGVLDRGTLRFVGAPHELAACATEHASGDTKLERGYAGTLGSPDHLDEHEA